MHAFPGKPLCIRLLFSMGCKLEKEKGKPILAIHPRMQRVVLLPKLHFSDDMPSQIAVLISAAQSWGVQVITQLCPHFTERLHFHLLYYYHTQIYFGRQGGNKSQDADRKENRWIFYGEPHEICKNNLPYSCHI